MKGANHSGGHCIYFILLLTSFSYFPFNNKYFGLKSATLKKKKKIFLLLRDIYTTNMARIIQYVNNLYKINAVFNIAPMY